MRPIALASLVVIALGLGACGSGPEGSIAGHMADLEEIMLKNMNDPAVGVEELRDYLRRNLPDAMRTVGAAIVELDEIEDADERRDRLEEMLDRLRGPMKSLQRTMMQFQRRVFDDDEARRAFERMANQWASLEDAFEEFAEDLDG